MHNRQTVLPLAHDAVEYAGKVFLVPAVFHLELATLLSTFQLPVNTEQ